MRRDNPSSGTSSKFENEAGQRHQPDQTTAMPDTVDRCSITLARTATAAEIISSSGMFSPSIPSTHNNRWSDSIQVRYNHSACPRLIRRASCQLLLFGPPWAHLVLRRRFLKKNQNAPRPSEHPPVREGKCQNV